MLIINLLWPLSSLHKLSQIYVKLVAVFSPVHVGGLLSCILKLSSVVELAFVWSSNNIILLDIFLLQDYQFDLTSAYLCTLIMQKVHRP